MVNKFKHALIRFSAFTAVAAACVYVGTGCVDQETYLKSRVVLLHGNGASCSGEQVRAPSGADYILTAGHCLDLVVDGSVEVTTEVGQHLMRKIIAEDKNADLLLIEGLPGVSGLEIATHSRKNQHVRTFTRGRGMPTYETSGVLITDVKIPIPAFPITSQKDKDRCEGSHKYVEVEEICILAVEETITTCQVSPGSSGGAVVNYEGALVGVVSGGGQSFGALVTLQDIHAFVDNY